MIVKNRVGKLLFDGDKNSLSGTDLSRANLNEKYLIGVNLNGCNLTKAHLFGTNLLRATLVGANLSGAKLVGAHLHSTNLSKANLTGANLSRATMTGAELDGAIMPDGRTWEVYKSDHMAGICDDPKIRARAILAWGKHTWLDCPMHVAFYIRESKDEAMALWVALYDSGLLLRPNP